MSPDSAAAAPLMARSLEELCAVANTVTTDFEIGVEEHFAFMSACFLAKQIEHARGVLLLGEHPDAELIARSMLEGLWQLQWAALEHDVRAARWRGFAYVHDWRAMLERVAAGKTVPEETRAGILAGIATYGERFHTSRARRAAAENQLLPDDPFDNTWYGVQVRQMAESVGDLDLYSSAYGDFSARHHWDPAGVARGISVDGLRISYSASSPSSRASAIAIAYLCVFRTAMTIDEAFNRGMRPALMSQYEEYLATGHAQA